MSLSFLQVKEFAKEFSCMSYLNSLHAWVVHAATTTTTTTRTTTTYKKNKNNTKTTTKTSTTNKNIYNQQKQLNYEVPYIHLQYDSSCKFWIYTHPVNWKYTIWQKNKEEIKYTCINLILSIFCSYTRLNHSFVASKLENIWLIF